MTFPHMTTVPNSLMESAHNWISVILPGEMYRGWRIPPMAILDC